MKKIKYIISVITFLLIMYSCNDSLLDTVSYNEIGSGNMWTSENLVDLGVNGVYNALKYPYVGDRLWTLEQDGYTAMDRDRTSWILGSSTFKSGVITSSDKLFTDYWQQHYEGIHRANDALSNLAGDVPVSEEKTARLIAEVKFLRAYFYFNLNKVFKGVPIYLEPVNVEDINRARASENEVWQTIISDLTDCINEPNLPDLYQSGNSDFGRATKAAAYALRGKTYLYMGDYSNAENDFRKVGDLGSYLFQGDYKMLFSTANEQHPEFIFSVQNIAQPGLGSITQKHLGSRVAFGSCWNNFLPNPDFVESFENIDGSTFNWDDFIPGYSVMSPEQRQVFFLRDGLTAEEITEFESQGLDMSLYLVNGNEARIMAAYDNRDPRLKSTIITPYSTFNGASGTTEHTYTLRWPYVGYDNEEPYDLRTDTRSYFFYLWRKWVYEGTSIESREYGPTDFPLIRYADVLLMLAEAINEQGFEQEAIDIVNQIRERAGAVLLQTSNSGEPTFVSGQEDLRERIQNERRWELALEGINLFDEMRWETWKDKKFYDGNGAKEIWGTLKYPFSWRGDYTYTWPIPRNEIERNNNLVQNTGWE